MTKRILTLLTALVLLLGFQARVPAGAEAGPGQGGYVFRPKVCNVFMKEIFGKPMCEAWYNLVDAVMAGEDTFACPDQHTYDWVMGQFPRLCFPVLPELITYAWDREHSVRDGVAEFTYLVPREEAAARIAEFAGQIEQILNNVLAKADTDVEKALALYEYFCHTYAYDWETYNKTLEVYVEDLSPLRPLRTGTGICSEISPLYSYLLMQAGVEATTMIGFNHEWSYVRLGGRHYHIDPTYALDNDLSLAYFMMSDSQREKDAIDPRQCAIASNYSKDHPHPDYTADDESFAPLWDLHLEAFLPEENRLRCWRYAAEWNRETVVFDYEQAD